MEILSQIKKIKIVPVVVFNDINEVEPVLNVMLDGGLPVAEICYRTECAPEALKVAVKN